MNLTMSETLNINGLNTPIKRQRLSRKTKNKTKQNKTQPKEIYFKYKKTYRLK